MNKPQIQTKNGNELITKENTNNKIRKSKFNKFFSTVTAVMIASSIAISPMTLRGEEMSESQKKEVVEKVNKYIETKENELKEKIKENDKKIEEAKKKIDENNKAIEEAKRKEMEARNKLCKGLEQQIPQMKEYCSKNTCDENQIKILNKSLNVYKEKCETLVVKSE